MMMSLWILALSFALILPHFAASAPQCIKTKECEKCMARGCVWCLYSQSEGKCVDNAVDCHPYLPTAVCCRGPTQCGTCAEVSPRCGFCESTQTCDWISGPSQCPMHLNSTCPVVVTCKLPRPSPEFRCVNKKWVAVAADITDFATLTGSVVAGTLKVSNSLAVSRESVLTVESELSLASGSRLEVASRGVAPSLIVDGDFVMSATSSLTISTTCQGHPDDEPDEEDGDNGDDDVIPITHTYYPDGDVNGGNNDDNNSDNGTPNGNGNNGNGNGNNGNGNGNNGNGKGNNGNNGGGNGNGTGNKRSWKRKKRVALASLSADQSGVPLRDSEGNALILSAPINITGCVTFSGHLIYSLDAEIVDDTEIPIAHYSCHTSEFASVTAQSHNPSPDCVPIVSVKYGRSLATLFFQFRDSSGNYMCIESDKLPPWAFALIGVLAAVTICAMIFAVYVIHRSSKRLIFKSGVSMMGKEARDGEESLSDSDSDSDFNSDSSSSIEEEGRDYEDQ